MERAFNFKLLVPPRSSLAQVSAVKPQDSDLFEESNSFMPPVHGYSKCFEKETSLPFSNTNMVLPSKSPRPDVAKKIAVLPMEKEETSLNCSHLYSKLFEEAEKIKSWKLKMDSEILQKDRKLQENRRIIETQRKAIQELQFGNESLSMKLEEQLTENEDLRNMNNATRNLCNILKHTFERSSEKMSFFEAEREETHGLFVQNHENIQRMVAAFENLRIQAEADQLEMLNVREGLKQLEDLKLRFENEYHMKEEEVHPPFKCTLEFFNYQDLHRTSTEQISILDGKLKEKQSNLNEVLLSLQETQQGYRELQESAKQHQELLHDSKQEQDKLEEKLKEAEQLRQEAEDHQKLLVNILEQTKDNYAKCLQETDAKLEEVNNIKEQLAHKLKEVKMTVESLQCSLTSEKQRAQEFELKHNSLSDDLNEKNRDIAKLKEQREECDNQIQLLKNELDLKSNALTSLEEQIKLDGEKLLQLSAKHEDKQTEINELKEKLQIAATENQKVALTLEHAINGQKQINEHVLLTESKLKDTEVRLSEALKNEREASINIKRLTEDLDQHKEKYEDLLERFHQLQLQKNSMQQAEVASESCPKETKECEEKMKMKVERLEMEKQELQMQLEVLSATIEDQRQDCENIQEQLNESNKNSQSELMKKEKHIKAQELKLKILKTKLEAKTKTLDEQLKGSKALKKQLALQNEKLLHHENEITELKEESQNLKKHYEEELKTVSSDLKNKTTLEAQLTLEVQKLKQTAVDAVKSKEDTEIKCQQKISDMVALMERHKHEYDKMVEEKDAELNEKRMREAEVNANKTSLELELSHLQVENGQLKQQLEKVTRDKGNLQQKVEELTQMQTSQKDSFLEKEGHLEQEILTLKKLIKSLEKDKTKSQISDRMPKYGKSSETPGAASTKMSVRALSKKAEVETSLQNISATPLKLADNLLTTPTWTLETKIGTTPRIKSFRIRTPPSTEKSAPWKKNVLELDPKSDSSDQNDTLSFSTTPLTSRKNAQMRGTDCQSLLKKVQNSSVCKSPGAALKLAAMKRMRDAGWTTITSSDKKKKKATDKIFA